MAYLVKRIIIYLVTVFLAISFTFILFRLMPGNPIGMLIATMEQQYSWKIPGMEKIINEYKRMFNLEGDIFSQYICFLKELILNRNLGPSLINFPKPAQDLIMAALPWTILLLTLSTVVAWGLGTIIGSICGWRRGTKLDAYITSLALYMSQVPYYFVAIILALILCYILSIFPKGGAFSIASTPSLSLEFILDVIKHAFLPSMSIVLTSLFGWIISMRSLVIMVLGEDYLLFAEAKGLKRRRLFTRYVMKNCLLPQVTGLALSLGFVVSGSVIVESVFLYPGIGLLFSRALGLMDYNVITGCALLIIVSTLTANLLIDLLYPLIDPRVRYGG
jgi:peptide/nickel transport system permease protein